MHSVLSSITSRKAGRRSVSGLLLAGTALCSAVALGAGISAFVPANQIAAADLSPPKAAASNGIICLAGAMAGEFNPLRGQPQAAAQGAPSIGDSGPPAGGP